MTDDLLYADKLDRAFDAATRGDCVTLDRVREIASAFGVRPAEVIFQICRFGGYVESTDDDGATVYRLS